VSDPPPTGQNEALWQQPHSPWLIAVVVTMATFMEVLDTSVAMSHCRISREIWRRSRRKYLDIDFVPRVQLPWCCQ